MKKEKSITKTVLIFLGLKFLEVVAIGALGFIFFKIGVWAIGEEMKAPTGILSYLPFIGLGFIITMMGEKIYKYKKTNKEKRIKIKKIRNMFG